MLRDEIKQRSEGYIAGGHLNLGELRTLFDVQRRLLANQIALRDIIGSYQQKYNVERWREHLQGIQADLELISRLINDYGPEERLT